MISIPIKRNESVLIDRLFGGFSMDVVAQCGFGLQVKSQDNKDDLFVKNAIKAFESFGVLNPALMLASELNERLNYTIINKGLYIVYWAFAVSTLYEFSLCKGKECDGLQL